MLGEKYPGLKIYTAMIDTELDARGCVLRLPLAIITPVSGPVVTCRLHAWLCISCS